MANEIRGFAPDRGLDDIARLPDAPFRMPAQRDAQLVGEPLPRQVEDLFERGALGERLRRFARLNVSDPTILTPHRYAALLQESARQLQDMASASDSETLRKAADLLSEQADLRALLGAYRNMLMKA